MACASIWFVPHKCSDCQMIILLRSLSEAWFLSASTYGASPRKAMPVYSENIVGRFSIPRPAITPYSPGYVFCSVIICSGEVISPLYTILCLISCIRVSSWLMCSSPRYCCVAVRGCTVMCCRSISFRICMICSTRQAG